METVTSLPNTAAACAISRTNLSDRWNSLPSAPGENKSPCARRTQGAGDVYCRVGEASATDRLTTIQRLPKDSTDEPRLKTGVQIETASARGHLMILAPSRVVRPSAFHSVSKNDRGHDPPAPYRSTAHVESRVIGSGLHPDLAIPPANHCMEQASDSRTQKLRSTKVRRCRSALHAMSLCPVVGTFCGR